MEKETLRGSGDINPTLLLEMLEWRCPRKDAALCGVGVLSIPPTPIYPYNVVWKQSRSSDQQRSLIGAGGAFITRYTACLHSNSAYVIVEHSTPAPPLPCPVKELSVQAVPHKLVLWRWVTDLWIKNLMLACLLPHTMPLPEPMNNFGPRGLHRAPQTTTVLPPTQYE
ncbi:hypothetical protein LZ31DRAFT_537343 [Colletotrichum somersetense]|nr:hypothetical protein LZ31DRAFT_537343 [Colletotrichum somersetense]